MIICNYFFVEFHEAFEVFSGGEMQLSTANSVLIPFLK